jgi:hypothetical protein
MISRRRLLISAAVLTCPFRAAAQIVGGGGATPVTWYADSVAGSDSNPGTSQALPFQTLAAVKTAIAANPTHTSVALKCGSSFREEISTATSIVSYGSGAAPIIDGANVVTGWTLTAGQTTVWQQSVTIDVVNISRLTAYQNGLLLLRVANVSTCASTPGSFVDPGEPLSSPVTVQINPGGANNPNTDGNTYEVSVREYGIQCSGDDSVVIGINTKRQLINNGSCILIGLGQTIINVLAQDGTKHNLWTGNGSNVVDSICCRWDATTAVEPSNNPIISYANSPETLAGNTINLTRVGVYSDISYVANSAAYFDHDDLATLLTNYNAQQIWIGNCNGFGSIAKNLSINGYFITNNSEFGVTAQSDNGSINYVQINDAVSGSTNQDFFLSKASAGGPIVISNLVSYDVGSPNPGLSLNSTLNGTFLAFLNCFFYHAGVRRTFLDGGGWTSGSLTIMNSIFANTAGGLMLEIPGGVPYVGNFNVFLSNGAAGTLSMKYNGTIYTTLAAWQAATGQDAHSIALGASDLVALLSGTVANGDFRLGSTGAGAQVAAIGAGPQFHWDWNARAVAAGPPTRWPTPPLTLANAQTYIQNPSAWSF